MVNPEPLSEYKIMELLSQIPDPDIPVVSIVELGIVRDVNIDDSGNVCVTITPTYSGCPAMSVFKDDISETLLNYGAKSVEIKIVHSPAWTTDWLSESTRYKMRKHGIAPPETNSTEPVALFSAGKQKIKCPHCSKIDTQLTSQFGSTPCKALWYCNSCCQPFEYFKCY